MSNKWYQQVKRVSRNLPVMLIKPLNVNLNLTNGHLQIRPQISQGDADHATSYIFWNMILWQCHIFHFGDDVLFDTFRCSTFITWFLYCTHDTDDKHDYTLVTWLWFSSSLNSHHSKLCKHSTIKKHTIKKHKQIWNDYRLNAQNLNSDSPCKLHRTLTRIHRILI